MILTDHKVLIADLLFQDHIAEIHGFHLETRRNVDPIQAQWYLFKKRFLIFLSFKFLMYFSPNTKHCTVFLWYLRYSMTADASFGYWRGV